MKKWSQWGNKNRFARILGRCRVPTVEINFFWDEFYIALTGLVRGYIYSIRGLLHRLVWCQISKQEHMAGQ